MSGVPAEVRLVNDIARQFPALPRAEARAAIAGHIAKFWDPRMRARLLELAGTGDERLDPLAAEAVSLLRAAA